MPTDGAAAVKKAVTAPLRSKPGKRRIPPILRPGNYTLVAVQEAFNKVFTPALNPIYYLGSITFLLFWVLLATGVYLFLFYEMHPVRAYESVRHVTEHQKYYGGIIRSLHRYASDGIMIVIAIHIVQVFFSDRFRKYRWVAWVSGAVIIPVIWFEGVSGYILVWDQNAQVVAQSMADILDALSINVEPLGRNFLTNDSVNALLFFVLDYLHMAIPGLLLLLSWIHCMRISMPVITPPAPMTVVILLSLLLLSLIKPATSAPAADLSKLVGDIQVDWFFLLAFPLLDAFHISPGAALFGGTAVFLLFTLMPWVISEPKAKPEPGITVPQKPITVDQDLCTECMLCQQACPFEAIKVTPSSPGAVGDGEATVSLNRCAECGFCVNACDFGAVSMGEWSKSAFQNHIERLLESRDEEGERPTSIAFVCERSFDQDKFYSPGGTRLAGNHEVACVTLPCIGMVSAALIEYSLDAGARGVMVVGCRPLDCHYREARRRLKLSEDPDHWKFLVEKMDIPNLKIMLISPFEIDRLMRDIDAFNEAVKTNGGGVRR